ncbi:MAG: methylated-DNA--[protein]-cysteine S-methyltransferase [Sphingomonadaceae bacterium]|nr:methylated-DNA--[protein]-cysteine S-methyltransferase [Sphingomonadaceae bacterium]
MPSHSFASPVGTVTVTADDHVLRSITISVSPPVSAAGSKATHPLLAEAERQLRAYFTSKSDSFDLPLAPASTRRGEELRAAIAAIAHGDTASYGELANRHGSGSRAIGQACRRNPFPIVVPCHRVIGAKGAIGHYSGGAGIATKARLLNHEAGKDGTRWAE